MSPKTPNVPVHELTVVSDVICPWCFIAKKNFDRALEMIRGDLALRIIWRPFELNPGMPPEGMDRREYRTQKFGSWGYSQKLDKQTVAAGKLAGVTFRYELMNRTPNTFEAHRMIWLAEQEGIQEAVVEALFSAYFMDGRDVGDSRALNEIARQAGMSENGVVAFAASSAGTEEVRDLEERAVRSGVSGVPTFLLDGVKLFSGALKPEEMTAQLRQAATTYGKR
jgi:predicted DsbA family dithiol-disulfide isomerase